jgi:hypothetical protein
VIPVPQAYHSYFARLNVYLNEREELLNRQPRVVDERAECAD